MDEHTNVEVEFDSVDVGKLPDNIDTVLKEYKKEVSFDAIRKHRRNKDKKQLPRKYKRNKKLNRKKWLVPTKAMR